MKDEDRRRAMIELARTMSAGEISVMQGAVAEPDGDQALMVTTTADSRSDVLWSEMTALGWMIAAGSLEEVPGTKLYEIPASGKPQIAQFLADLDRSAAMTRIINELRGDIARRLLAAVRSVDGTPGDLAILVASIVDKTMRVALKPDLYDDFLREVAKVAEQMRSSQ
jgi:hypothetical protein